MREWVLSTGGVTLVTNALQTLVFTGPSNTATYPSLEFLRHWVGYSGTATSAQEQIGFSRMLNQQTATTNLTAATPVRLNPNDVASTCTVSGSVTIGAGLAGFGVSTVTEQTAGTGTETFIWKDAFNVLNGYLKVNTPLETEKFATGITTFARLQLLGTSRTGASWAFGQVFREI